MRNDFFHIITKDSVACIDVFLFDLECQLGNKKIIIALKSITILQIENGRTTATALYNSTRETHAYWFGLARRQLFTIFFEAENT